MAHIDYPAEIADLRHTYESIAAVSDVEQIRADIVELSKEASAPNLWDDPAIGQQVTSALSRKEHELERLTSLHARIDDLEVMAEHPPEGNAPRLHAEAAEELHHLSKDLPQLGAATRLSDKYDVLQAVVTLLAGGGRVAGADYSV